MNIFWPQLKTFLLWPKNCCIRCFLWD